MQQLHAPGRTTRPSTWIRQAQMLRCCRAAAQLTLPAKAGVNAHLKVPALVGAMVAGADSSRPEDHLLASRYGGSHRARLGTAETEPLASAGHVLSLPARAPGGKSIVDAALSRYYRPTGCRTGNLDWITP